MVRRAKPPSAYRSVSGQGRRDRGAAGRYRWACRLWPHAVKCYVKAAAMYQSIAMREPLPKPPPGDDAVSAIRRLHWREMEAMRTRAGLEALFSMSEAVLATFTPRFSRVP